MLKEFLNERKERIQKLIDNGFEVEIEFKNDVDILGSRVIITIVYKEPWFCKCGSFWVKDNDDRGFTEAIEAAEKFDININIVDDFIKSLIK